MRAVHDAGADLLVVGSGDLRARGSAARLPPPRPSAGMSLERALELGAAARGRAYPKPTVGAVIVRDGEVVGEGATEAGGRHGEIVALAGGGRARARRDALRDARAVRAPRHDAAVHRRDPRRGRRARRLRLARPESRSAGRARAAARGRRRGRARRPLRGTRPRTRRGAPGSPRAAVRHLQGGGDARRPRDGARLALGHRGGEPAASSTSCARSRTRSRSAWAPSGREPRASTRATSPVTRQPRRLAFGSGPLPGGSELELRSGALDEELRALAADGVQSLLLEGGPTLAAAFLAAASSTSCCSSSRRRSRERGRSFSTRSRRRSR